MDDQTFERQVHPEPLVSTEHPELLHYTGISSLTSILESNTLWATDARCLNDSSELKLLWPKLEPAFKEVLRDAISGYVKLNPNIEDNVSARGGIASLAEENATWLTQLLRHLLFGTTEEPGLAIPYIVSFCGHTDSDHREQGMLSQWRGYGGNDGVAIVFDTVQLENLLCEEYEQGMFMHCVLQEAVYLGPDVDLHGHLSTLMSTAKTYAEYEIEGRDKQDTVVQKNAMRLQEESFITATRFKHSGFREEQECRIVVGVPHQEHHDGIRKFGEIRQVKRIHYRSSHGGSIPYIKLFDNLRKKLPISRILIAPSSNQEANFETVCALVHEKGLDESIQVHKSDIPYVGST